MASNVYRNFEVAGEENPPPPEVRQQQEIKSGTEQATEKMLQSIKKGPPPKAKPFNPFEGIPLSPFFPKTPINFHKGEPIIRIKDDEKKVEDTKSKISYNPFEGVPLAPDFPKTPLKFHKGHVVGEPKVIVTNYDDDMKKDKQKRDHRRAKGSKGGGDDDRWYD